MSNNNQKRPNPYVGPRAFKKNEELYGRDQETHRLLDRFIANRLVLLYSPSGAGKTSLICAALIPKLRKERFQVLPVMRVGRSPHSQVKMPDGVNHYVLSVLSSLEEGLSPHEEKMTPDELASMRLNEYLNHRKGKWENTVKKENDHPFKSNEISFEVLIFDQFEEIITLDIVAQEQKKEFFTQVSEVLDDQRRWGLFAMREEYIAALNPYLDLIPTRLKNTFRLELLGENSACQAIQKPAQKSGVEFTKDAIEKLLKELRGVRIQQPDGHIVYKNGPYVEPVLLQVVCHHIWEKIDPDVKKIKPNDIPGRRYLVDERTTIQDLFYLGK